MQLNLTPEEYEEVIDKRINCLECDWLTWMCERFGVEFYKEYQLVVHNVPEIGVWDFFSGRVIKRIEEDSDVSMSIRTWWFGQATQSYVALSYTSPSYICSRC